jgi:hypothetical protein
MASAMKRARAAAIAPTPSPPSTSNTARRARGLVPLTIWVPAAIAAKFHALAEAEWMTPRQLLAHLLGTVDPTAPARRQPPAPKGMV